MDPAALARLHAQAFTRPPPWTAEAFATLLSMPGVFLVTAPDGFALGRAIAGEAELLTIAVAPAARRRGIGAGLLADFLAEAGRRNATRAFLDVAATNAVARALYGRAGFVQVARRAGYYRDADGRDDALVLARDLPEPAGQTDPEAVGTTAFRPGPTESG